MPVCVAAKQSTVLLVEKEPTTRVEMVDFLTEAGFNVIETGSAGEAWKILDIRSDIQVVLVDLDTTGSANGLELAQSVHERWPCVGFVMMSDQVRRLSPTEMPGNGSFLPRPIPTETLLQEIRTVAHIP